MGLVDMVKKKLIRLKAMVKEILQKPILLTASVKKNIASGSQQAPTRPMQAAAAAAVAAEKSKYYTGPEARYEPRRAASWDLPGGYGRDEIVLQVRDPWWLHAYWELTHGTIERLRHELGQQFDGARRILRVYDVSFINFDGTNANRFFDIEIGDFSSHWYIDTQAPGRSWCVDVGLRLANGRFIKIARSNVVMTPLDGPSWQTDEEWMIPEDLFARLYGYSLGASGSSPVGVRKLWEERLKRDVSSGAMASGGFSPVKKPEVKRGFWLVVNAELIVYGATEPDAKVTLQGKPLTLRPDGTFSVRFALPDGKQVIPVKAVSVDGVEERTITPIVSRETK